MSPAGETLRRRCRNFPGLVNNTVIDWFFPWPQEALKAVAERLLEEDDLPSAQLEVGIGRSRGYIRVMGMRNVVGQWQVVSLSIIIIYSHTYSVNNQLRTSLP